MRNNLIDPRAEVSKSSVIGVGTSIDGFSIISPRVYIGENCKIHNYIFIDECVHIGNNVKIQNNVMIPHGVTLEDGVFVGPSVAFTNDRYPRSVTPDGIIKSGEDWTLSETLIKEGASLGANATVICGITIGKWAMIGAGTVVNKDVPDFALVVGNPSRQIGWISKSGYPLKILIETEHYLIGFCEIEKKEYKILK